MVAPPIPRSPTAIWGGFTWFAYFDPESETARALCGSLGLYVVRPSVQDAIAELRLLVTDYVGFARGQTEYDVDPADIKRLLPADAWEEQSEAFCRKAKTNDMRGSQWDCGEILVLVSGDTLPT